MQEGEVVAGEGLAGFGGAARGGEAVEEAGEDGLLGPEEARLLKPAAKRAGLMGPIAADTAWRWHKEGKLDGLVCLYHDQALIPVKMLDFWGGVNVTLGLPIVRTSPDHGTAFDIAGTGRADASSLVAAIGMARRLSAAAAN